MLKVANMLKIKVFPRIHISLIGMNYNGYRLNGGIGFSIATPTLDIVFRPSDSIDVIDNRKEGFTDVELKKLQTHLNDIRKREKLNNGMCCFIQTGMIQSHVGFGSNTMVYLSCIEALLIINNRKYSNNEIIVLASRGGTSGIGINTYFSGGFVFDTGIANIEQHTLAPSSSFVGQPVRMPLLFKQLKLPQWELGICIFPIKHKSEDEEKDFFKTKCPIEQESVEKILYESVYGVTSSLMENDFHVFCKSIDAIQQTRWKMLERSVYGDELVNIETIIRRAGAQCVGMSSFGPLLYFFGNDIDSIVEKVNNELSQRVCFKTAFNNSSRIVGND